MRTTFALSSDTSFAPAHRHTQSKWEIGGLFWYITYTAWGRTYTNICTLRICCTRYVVITKAGAMVGLCIRVRNLYTCCTNWNLNWPISWVVKTQTREHTAICIHTVRSRFAMTWWWSLVCSSKMLLTCAHIGMNRCFFADVDVCWKVQFRKFGSWNWQCDYDLVILFLCVLYWKILLQVTKVAFAILVYDIECTIFKSIPFLQWAVYLNVSQQRIKHI